MRPTRITSTTAPIIPAEGVSARHFEGAIQGTFGGAVSYIKLKDWNNDVNDTNRNRLWCYPGSPDGGNVDTGHNPALDRRSMTDVSLNPSPNVTGSKMKPLRRNASGSFEIFGLKLSPFGPGVHVSDG